MGLRFERSEDSLEKIEDGSDLVTSVNGGYSIRTCIKWNGDFQVHYTSDNMTKNWAHPNSSSGPSYNSQLNFS